MADNILNFKTSCPVFLEDGDAKITTPYGESIPDYPSKGKTGSHYGLDMVRHIGYSTTATIVAFEAGTIKEVRKNVKGVDRTNHTAGNYVKIEHEGGYITRYLHMKYGSIPDSISVGAKVTKGDVIGRMGNTGNSYGAHLHFEVWENGKKVDPEPYLIGEKKMQVVVDESVKTEAVIHKVVKGDTLGEIAKAYGTTVNAIVEANDIKNPDDIRIGQKLIIPVSSSQEKIETTPVEDSNLENKEDETPVVKEDVTPPIVEDESTTEDIPPIIEDNAPATEEDSPIVEIIREKGTVVLLNTNAVKADGSSIFCLYHLFKLYIQSSRIEDDKIIYTVGIFKDMPLFCFETTEDNFTIINI